MVPVSRPGPEQEPGPLFPPTAEIHSLGLNFGDSRCRRLSRSETADPSARVSYIKSMLQRSVGPAYFSFDLPLLSGKTLATPPSHEIRLSFLVLHFPSIEDFAYAKMVFLQPVKDEKPAFHQAAGGEHPSDVLSVPP